MTYTATTEPDPAYFANVYSLSQSRMDAWNRVADVTGRLAERSLPGALREGLEGELAGALAFLRGLEGLWVFPGAERLEQLEVLAGLGHWGELAQNAKSMVWHLGLFGDSAGMLWPGERTLPPGTQHFTVVLASDVDQSLMDRAISEMHAFRRPYDQLVYEVIGVRSFDAALACVLLNHEVQAVIMRPDVPLRSGAAFGLLDRLLDEYDEEFGLSRATEKRRARALATILRRARPRIDLYLLTDEAVPEESDPTMLAFDRAFYRYESRSELHMTLLNGVRTRMSTPFFDALKQYADKPIGNFHALPIARGNSVFNSPWLRDMVGLLRAQHLPGRDVLDLRRPGLAAGPDTARSRKRRTRPPRPSAPSARSSPPTARRRRTRSSSRR